MKKPQFEVGLGKGDKIHATLKSSNGETLLYGRGFNTKPETIHAIAAIMRYGLLDSAYVRRTSEGKGYHFFQIKSPSGRILGWSDMLNRKTDVETRIDTIKKALMSVNIIDATE